MDMFKLDTVGPLAELVNRLDDWLSEKLDPLSGEMLTATLEVTGTLAAISVESITLWCSEHHSERIDDAEQPLTLEWLQERWYEACGRLIQFTPERQPAPLVFNVLEAANVKSGALLQHDTSLPAGVINFTTAAGEVARISSDGIMSFKVAATDEHAREFVGLIEALLEVRLTGLVVESV